MRDRTSVITFIGCLIAGACGFFGEARVTVVNHTNVEVRNVVLSGRGFSVGVRTIPPGQSAEVKVQPRGESGVAVAFDANGRRVTAPLQGYVESHDGYRVRVEIKPDFSVNVDTTISEGGGK